MFAKRGSRESQSEKFKSIKNSMLGLFKVLLSAPSIQYPSMQERPPSLPTPPVE